MDDDLLSRMHRDRDWDTDDIEQLRKSFPRRTAFAGTLLFGALAVCWYAGGYWAWLFGPVLLRYAVILLGVGLHLLRCSAEKLEPPPWKPILNRSADGVVGVWLAAIAAPSWSLLVLPGLELWSTIWTQRVFRMHLGWARFGTPFGCFAKVTCAQLLGYMVSVAIRRGIL